jgi:hypothetical protein
VNDNWAAERNDQSISGLVIDACRLSLAAETGIWLFDRRNNLRGNIHLSIGSVLGIVCRVIFAKGKEKS